ncbi:MAG: DEAD/DEAH box helicase [Pirellulaceae bacterium]|nr:DEAD/DEAH box helicase [Pirellulaceae bacterium]
MAKPVPSPVHPTTPAERLLSLDQLQQDLAVWENDHRQAGVRLPSQGLNLSSFFFDAKQGTLAAHAPGKACRVTLYLAGQYDGRMMVPHGVARLSGTCSEFRRRRWCQHTLTAVRRLATLLGEKGNVLRERLFQLGQGEEWRQALQLVEHFLVSTQPAPATVVEQLQTRVVWRVEYLSQDQPDGNIQVTMAVLPFEQKIGKGGNWTRGRKLSLDEFSRLEASWTSEADRRTAQRIKESLQSPGYRYGFGSSYDYYSPQPTLRAYDLLLELIGHPLITWEDAQDTPVEVVKGEFGLIIKEEPGGWRIRPAINGQCPPRELIWSAEGNKFEKPLWVDRANNRVVLGVGDSAAVTLAAKLSTIPDPIPPEGQQLLLAKLAVLQSRLPVTLPDSHSGGTLAADRRLVLRLAPQNPAGIVADLVVVPVAERAAYAPGEGPPILSVLKDGKQFRYERQLADERRRASDAVETLRLAQFTSARPWHWHLPTSDDALDLLAQLADQPVDDLIVQWPEGQTRTVSQVVPPAALRVQIESQQDWFGLNGTVEIDGQEVELAKILGAMRKGHRYVEVGPNQFVRLAQTLRQSLEALDDVTHETKSGKLEFDITAAPVLKKVCDPSIELKTCLAWDESLARLEKAEEHTPDPPITLAADLRDYQVEGFRWLSRLAAWGMGGCLADDMGLGKTVQTLATLIDRMEEGPALVIAPTSVAFNWVREAQRFAPTLRPILYRETDRDDVLQNLAAGDVLIVSYGLLLRDVEKLGKVEWGTLVLDEAQKIKNSVTKTAQAVRQIEAKWRLALTGTPLENHLGELWSIFRAVCPGLLGSWDRFRTKFAEPIERQKDSGRRRALARLMRPFILRRTKSEVLEELPDRTEIIRTAELTPDERQRYQAARLAAIADLAGAGESEAGGPKDRRFEVLAALTRLRQLACHPKLVDAEWPGGSAKLELFMEIVEELREGNHRALVFSQFVQHLSLIRGALDAAGITYQYLDGQTPPKDRERRVDAFQRGEGELFLISLKAGGTGLNLTAADYVIHMDPWWNPAVEDQATDRAHRIGQTRPVTVYRLVTKDTIEEQILALHAGKRHLVADVLEGTDQAGKLSTLELVSLIRGEAEDSWQPSLQRP